jgi:hypothetical protein
MSNRYRSEDKQHKAGIAPSYLPAIRRSRLPARRPSVARLLADQPSMEVLEQRTQLLAARFAPRSSKKGARS